MQVGARHLYCIDSFKALQKIRGASRRVEEQQVVILPAIGVFEVPDVPGGANHRMSARWVGGVSV